MRARRAAAATLALALLAGCGTGGVDDRPASADEAPTAVDPAPVPVGTPAPEVPVDRWLLPSSWQGAVAVDPSWDRVLGERDGIVLGLSEPDDGPVTVSAVDSEGEVRWTSARPAGHTEVGLSGSGGTAVVVLTQDATSGVAAWGHSLESGARLWGPVEVPGPVVGPGLVLGTGEGAGTGGTVALDAATGAVVAGDGAAAAVAESDGWVLTRQDGEIAALAPGDRTTPAWTATPDHLGLSPEVRATGSAPSGTVLLGPTAQEAADDGAATGTLVEVTSGRPVATRVGVAMADSATGTWVVLGAGTVSGHGPQGPLWSRPAQGAELAAVGGALVYLREGDAVRVLNTLTGAEAVAYEGDAAEGYVVPAMVTSVGSAVARTDRLVLLTTSPSAP